MEVEDDDAMRAVDALMSNSQPTLMDVPPAAAVLSMLHPIAICHTWYGGLEAH